MTRTYVAISDPVHGLLRRLTHQTPLIPRHHADGGCSVVYDFRPENLPGIYYSLAVHHSLNGMPVHEVMLWGGKVSKRERAGVPERVSYFDVVKMDRRCLRDLRWRARVPGPTMLAAELLTYGSGMIRALNDDPQDHVHRYLWSRYGRLTTRRELVFAEIRALQSRPVGTPLESRKETYESTNLIYGDAYGELEQLWDRRADTDFLGTVVRSLHYLRPSSGLVGHLHPPLNLGGLMQLHRRAQKLWHGPPTSARGLLRRLEFILDHTLIDSSPEVASCEAAEDWAENAREADWQIDKSGYDGWLGAS